MDSNWLRFSLTNAKLPAVANTQWNWTVRQMYKQKTDNRVPGNPDCLLRSYDHLVVNHVSPLRRTAELNFDTPLWSSELMLWAVSAQFKLLFLFPDLNEPKQQLLLVLKRHTQFLSSLLPYFILSYPKLINHSRDTCFKCGKCAYEPNS